MNRKEHIQKEVDRTLDSLEGIRRATANPYLFTRIRARMEQGVRRGTAWELAGNFFSRPAIALSTLVLVILINVLVITSANGETIPETSSYAVNDIADEYRMASSINLEYEIPATDK